MINMLKLDFHPRTAAWVHQGYDIIQSVAISDANSGTIYIFDGRGATTPIHVLDKLHTKPVYLMEYNTVLDIMVSIDEMGMLEYWSGSKSNYEFPSNVSWEFKTDTDLYEFVKVCLFYLKWGSLF